MVSRAERSLVGAAVGGGFDDGTLERAVERARSLAAPGDVVLLSPACASFDQYSSYEERGAHFRRLVESLP